MDELPAQLHVQLYSKLAATLSVAGVVGQDPSSILSLQIPGTHIRAHRDLKDPQTQFYIANALDPVLACSWSVTRRAGSISDVYKSVLDGKETPLISLPPARQAELDAALAALYDADDNPTATYSDYQSHQLGYLQALDEYEAAAATQANGGPPIPFDVSWQLAQRELAWRDQGFKAETERALAVVAQYEAYEPLVYWTRLAERYARHTRVTSDHSEFQFVTSNPPYESWFNDEGWSRFSFDDTDFNHQPRSGGVGVDDTGCCCCQRLPERASPSAFAESETQRSQSLASFGEGYESFKLTCELRRIEIIRPWLDTNVFFSRAWRWSPASVSYGVTVSTGGDIAGRQIPRGVMPVVPATAILARNLEIHWEDGTKTTSAIAEHLGQGRHPTFGPFRLSRATLTAEHTITVLDPQVIAYISTVLPRCPNPDPALRWPDPAVAIDEWP